MMQIDVRNESENKVNDVGLEVDEKQENKDGEE